MNILQSLETYVSAQKWVGTNFIILGAILIAVSSVVALFVTKSPLATGMKWGSLVCGLLIIAGGISYSSFNKKILYKGESLFNKSKIEFVQYEHERMEKVDNGFLTYQLVFAAFVVASLVVILFVKAPLLKGIAFAVAILFIGQLIIEGFSHASIEKYTNELRQEVQK
ncbi:hypothetical protein [Flammeovirga sp. EKP202]|uniref:hypothetical protein n=1 Tax=Flammeovirga sp. EKP202 TaxID=2770592 RepID=UPI00165F910D|nr:hypothetical protein [Flammeovirga sp. EKP202]MBD0401790.1 hypothetical protein [Flammeovirga sp. EKP202]